MKKSVRIMCLILAGAMLLGLFTTIIMGLTYAKADGGGERSETVYVDLDYDGKATKILSSVYITNPDKLDIITDESTLTNLKNVAGTKKPDIDGNKSIWSADKEDVSYQGEGSAALPVEVKIKYFLDGKPIKAEELAGKSGRVKMTFEFKDLLPKTVMVEGKEVDMFVPFTLVTMVALDEKFKNITATNAKVTVEGGVPMIMGTTFLGLADSLGVEKKDKLAESFEFEADVTDFSLKSSSIMLINGIVDQSDLSGLDDVADLTSGLDDMEDAAKKLENGAKKLRDGAVELKDGIEKYADGAGELADGMTDIVDAAQKIADGLEEVRAGISEVGANMGNIGNGIGQVKTQLGAALNIDQSALGAAIGGAIGKWSATNGNVLTSAQIGALTADVGTAVGTQLPKPADISKLVGALDTLERGAHELDAGAGKAAGGANELLEGMKKLIDGIKEAKDGAIEYKAKSSELIDGANDLADGIDDVRIGLGKLRREGISKMIDETADISVSVSRKDAIMELSDSYTTYSGLSTNKSSVKFVLSTKEIFSVKPLEPSKIDEFVEDAPAAELNFFEKIWQWIVNLFK